MKPIQKIAQARIQAQQKQKELYEKTYYSIMFAIDFTLNELGDNNIRYEAIPLIEYLVSQQKKYYIRLKEPDAEIKYIVGPPTIKKTICELLNLNAKVDDVTIDELYQMYEISGKPKVNPFKVMKQIDSMKKVL